MANHPSQDANNPVCMRFCHGKVKKQNKLRFKNLKLNIERKMRDRDQYQ